MLGGAVVVRGQLPRLDSISENHLATPFRDTSLTRHRLEAPDNIRIASYAEQATRCDDFATIHNSSDSSDSTRWSRIESQFQFGNLDSPSFASGQTSSTNILTLQHASGWKYGDNFFFVDIIDDEIEDGFNNNDVYLEWYANFSLGKILGRRIGCVPILFGTGFALNL